MTESELLELATSALPEHMQSLTGTVVWRGPAADGPGLEIAGGEDLLKEMEQLLNPKGLPGREVFDSDSGDVAFHEDTPLGQRTTVVQIRHGKVAGRIGQA